MSNLLLALLIACGGSPHNTKELCNDGYDNDDDGLADCADDECFGSMADRNGDGVDDPCPELCGDSQDNDGDGLVDCEDPACDGGSCPEVCTDLRDNDKDGKWDCNDPDCAVECDVDGDGRFNADFGGDDCDDTNAAVYPDALEVCDGVDNDCDELVDLDDPKLEQDTLTTWYGDADGDGFGLTFDAVEDCFQPSGRVDVPDDCDDSDPDVNPAALELCDGYDNDCDTLIDDLDPSVDLASAETWYPDLDGDGFGSNSNPINSCAPIPGRASNSDDCDDTIPTIGASGLWVVDGDGDGFGTGAAIGPAGCTPPGPTYVSESLPDDCNDIDPTINPGAVDPCGDGLDFDCDTLDCVNWAEGFEFGIGFLWTLGGNANWFAQGNTIHNGAFAGECGNINDSQQSWLEVTRTFPAGGAAIFWSNGSTESNYDFLKFYVDGVETYSRSGTWGWTQSTFPVTPGVHTLKWEYRKDGSVSSGSDTIWLDDIEFTGANP